MSDKTYKSQKPHLVLEPSDEYDGHPIGSLIWVIGGHRMDLNPTKVFNEDEAEFVAAALDLKLRIGS